MSPNSKPIINSVYDIPNVPGLKITVSRNLGVDVMLQVTYCFFNKVWLIFLKKLRYVTLHSVLFYTANQFQYFQETWRFIKRRSESSLQCNGNLPWQSSFWKSCLHSRKLTSHYYYKITFRRRIFFTKKREKGSTGILSPWIENKQGHVTLLRQQNRFGRVIYISFFQRKVRTGKP
jgi:hypothetical protein